MPTDLLGDPTPETPKMTDPLPWRIFAMDDCDWFVARSLEDAKAAYMAETGIDAQDIADAQELSEEALDRLHFVDTDEDDVPQKNTRRTFRQELAMRVAAGLSKPELFASTEY